VIDEMGKTTLSVLEALLAPGEQVYIFDEPPKKMNGLSVGPPLHTFQMLAPEDPQLEIGENEARPIPLNAGDASEMFDLITVDWARFSLQRLRNRLLPIW
jgi:hypothetical protein